MQIVVISKKVWIGAVAAIILAIVGIIIWVGATRKSVQETFAPSMTVTNGYELNTVPYTAREIPVYQVKTDDSVLALTIDAAWDTDKTQFILDTLDQHQIKATFFLCGVWVEAYPDYVKEIAARGHEIGNHSLTHPHMNRLSTTEIEQEISMLDDKIEKLTGKRCTLFRAPFGEYNDTVVKSVRSLGYEVVQWNIDTVDWKESRTSQAILDSVLPKLENGSIILCHNNGFAIEEYLPKLIDAAKEQGYRFVTVSELLPNTDRNIDNNGVWQS